MAIVAAYRTDWPRPALATPVHFEYWQLWIRLATVFSLQIPAQNHKRPISQSVTHAIARIAKRPSSACANLYPSSGRARGEG